MSEHEQSREIVTLQKQLKDKEHELNIAYQTSLELIETNHELQKHLEEQNSTIEILDAKTLDYEMKIDMLEAENQEYQQTILQTNDKYEQILGELAVTREHYNLSKDAMSEYKHIIQSLNHDIINNKHNNYKQTNKYNNNNNKHNYNNKLLKQQNKYDKLLRECEKLRNESQQLINAQIEIENMKKEHMKVEKRNKLLSDKIVELTEHNAQLEKEITDYSLNITEQRETIKYLQTYSSIYVNNDNEENIDLKRKLSIQLRDNFSDNSKLVMFANTINTIDESNNMCLIDYNITQHSNDNNNNNNNNNIAIVDNGLIDNEEEENDLFTMVENYQNNENDLFTMVENDFYEYLRNNQIEQEREETPLLLSKYDNNARFEAKKSIDCCLSIAFSCLNLLSNIKSVIWGLTPLQIVSYYITFAIFLFVFYIIFHLNVNNSNVQIY